MSTTILRSRILDLAIRGQLVPQDPNEGTADDLLKTIATQRGKAITPITDNVPFDIPANWRWVKLGDIAKSSLGKTLNSRTDVGDLMPYLCSINVYSSGIDLSLIKRAHFTEEEKAKYLLQKGDLMICEGGDAGRCCIWDKDEEMYYQNALHRVRFYGGISSLFFKYIFDSYKEHGTIGRNGVTIQHFTQTQMKQLFFPLPPLAEQHRIVAKVEELLSEVDKIEQAQADITQAATILRTKIIQAALNGDYSNNILEWKYDKLANVLDYEQPGAYIVNSTDYSSEYTTPVLTAGKSFILGYTNETTGIYSKGPCIIFDDFTTDSKYVDFPFKVKSSAMKILQPSKDVDLKYVYYFMSITRLIGDTHKRFWISEYSQLEIPLPPLAEQKRIVAKIEQLFTEIDKLV